MPCYSPLKGYQDPETGKLVFKKNGHYLEEMEVGCGQCLGCRLDRARVWTMRLVHESTMHDLAGGNCFVTLTYRDRSDCNTTQLARGQYLKGLSLRKKHFQDFMKRLRKSRPDSKIKFYHAGEYGGKCRHGLELDKVKCPLCTVGRPHYHAIIFGTTFHDLELWRDEDGNQLYVSEELEKIWGFGFATVGAVTYQSAGYVARYIMKKVTGPNAEEHYTQILEDGEMIEVLPEYSTMSKGIGKAWFEKYNSDCYPSDEVPVPGQGVIKKVPRYYRDIQEIIDPQSVEDVRERREQFFEKNKEEFTPDRLMSKYKVKKAQIQTLKRTILE